jgi:hypothetical protein
VEAERLLDLFGPPARYGETLRPMLWTHVAQVVVGFTGETEVALSIPCSYDFEVAAHTYLGALEDGKIPLNLLFSGTVFVEGESGVTSEFVPWTCEARYQLPVATWRDAMEAFFPNGRWIRLDREAFDELQRFKSAGAFPTWDRAIAALCASARVAT